MHVVSINLSRQHIHFFLSVSSLLNSQFLHYRISITINVHIVRLSITKKNQRIFSKYLIKLLITIHYKTGTEWNIYKTIRTLEIPLYPVLEILHIWGSWAKCTIFSVEEDIKVFSVRLKLDSLLEWQSIVHLFNALSTWQLCCFPFTVSNGWLLIICWKNKNMA